MPVILHHLYVKSQAVFGSGSFCILCNTYKIISLQKLLEAFGNIKSVKVHRAALWILGEYTNSVTDIEAVVKQVHRVLGEGQLVEAEQRLLAGDTQPQEEVAPTSAGQTTTLVTSDGTYATQSAFNTVT